MTRLAKKPDTVEGRRANLAVVAAFLVHGLLFSSWAAHIPPIKADLGLSDGTLGLALLGVPCGSVLAMPLCGYLLPRIGSRIVVQVTLLGYCAAGPFVGIAGSFWGLVLTLFAWGAFMGTLDISMNTQGIAVEHHRERPLMNGFHAWWSVGAFTGALAGTLGVALGAGLTSQLIVLGIPALLAAGFLSRAMLPDAAEEPTKDDADPAPATRQRRISPAMLVLGGVALGSMLCEGAAADWSSVYLRDSLDSANAGLAYASFALAMVAVRVAGNRLLDRFPLNRLLPALASLAVVGMTLTLVAAQPVVAMIGFFTLGLGLGAVVPSAFSAAGRLPGMHAGVGVAAVSALGWVGFVCGPPIIGGVAHLSSLPTALIIIPVITGLIAVACFTAPAFRAKLGPGSSPG